MAVLQYRGSFSVFKNWERNNDNLNLTGSKTALGMSTEFSILKNYILPIPMGSLAKIYSVFILVLEGSVQFSSVQLLSCVRLFAIPWTQHARPPCPSPTSRVHSDSRPSSQWCHPAISSSVIPFSCCPHLSQHQGLFLWVNSSHEVAKVLEFQL